MMLWTTKDGRRVSPKKMSVEHIKNCVAMLRRQGYISEAEFVDMCGWGFSMNGEMASYYAEQEAANAHPTRMLDIMEAELDSRAAR